MGRVWATIAACPVGSVRIQVSAVGLDQVPSAPPVIRTGGATQSLTVLRSWTSLRGATPRGPELLDGWSTLVQFPIPQGSHAIRMEVDVPGSGCPPVGLRAKPLPSSLPIDPLNPFNVLLVSCYHVGEDQGVAQRAKEIARTNDVHLTVLMGDQVYLDLPTLDNLPSTGEALADALERKYRVNFQPGSDANFAAVLDIAPNIAVPDDHEYWNNAPHPSPIVQNSWRQAGRTLWKDIADALFVGYQGLSPGPGATGPFEFEVLDVGALSFFVANTRSYRTENRQQCMSSATLASLQQWAVDLEKAGRFGILVTGQSLLDAKSDALEGRVADFALSNYGDYSALVAAMDGLARKADVLLLTGDVHWGRVARLSPTSDARGEATIYEVISSPAALVTTVIADPVKSFFRRMSGSKDRWPRHSEAPVVPRLLRLEGAGTPFWTETLHRQKGDMLTLLSFSQVGETVRVVPRFFPIGTHQVDEVEPVFLRCRPS